MDLQARIFQLPWQDLGSVQVDSIVMDGEPPFCRMTDISAIVPITKIIEFLKK